MGRPRVDVRIDGLLACARSPVSAYRVDPVRGGYRILLWIKGGPDGTPFCDPGGRAMIYPSVTRAREALESWLDGCMR